MELPDATLTGMESHRQERSAMWGRRLVLTTLLLFVTAGGAGFLGVRSETEVADDGGVRLSVEHAAVARAGLDVPWKVTVTRTGGFGKTLTLAVTGSYFDIFETQGFTPDPDSATRDGDTLYLTFLAPESDTFVVEYDAYIQPASQRGRSATVAVVTGTDHRPLASVHTRTTLLP